MLQKMGSVELLTTAPSNAMATARSTTIVLSFKRWQCHCLCLNIGRHCPFKQPYRLALDLHNVVAWNYFFCGVYNWWCCFSCRFKWNCAKSHGKFSAAIFYWALLQKTAFKSASPALIIHIFMLKTCTRRFYVVLLNSWKICYFFVWL